MKLVAAFDANYGIGKNNKLPWNNKEDLEHFKKITYNQKIVMGRTTFESLPKVLSNRHHIVFSRQENKSTENVDFIRSVDQLLAKYSADELYVIGGSMIYELLFWQCDEMYLTYLYESYDCDTFFPSRLLEASQGMWDLQNVQAITDGAIIHYKRKING